MSNLKIDPARLWDSLMETAQMGGTPDGGVARLTLSDEDAQVRAWLRAQCDALGMTMVVDQAGNMFASRPGRRSDLAPLAMGSHLDTQPTGGKFDGILGVLAGLEVLRTLDGAGFQTEAPIMLVNWTNEEGSRFVPATLGSGYWAGLHDRGYIDARTDAQGVTFGSALDRIGWRGEADASAVRFGAMFELHIEQGPILEAEGKQIGVVQGVQGMRWFELSMTGTAAHTGSTPMALRRNALVGMAAVIAGVDRIARSHENAVGTVGFVEVSPNSHNVIPGHVKATIDLRHPDDAVLDAMERDITALVADAAGRGGLDHEFAAISREAPVTFDADCIASVRAGAAAAGLTTIDIVSGGGHDAVHVAALAPTTMIFVPSQGGLSHNPGETTSAQDCAAGAQVLLEAVLDYDRRMAERRRDGTD